MMKKTSRLAMMSEQGAEPFSARGETPRPCPRAAEWEPLLYDFAEGLADKDTAAAVTQHTDACAYCRAALTDIRRMTAALQASAPEPKPGLHTRIMRAGVSEDETNGRVLAETVDLRTGRVLSDPAKRRGLAGAISGVAAALIVVIGLIYLMPFLRINSGASTGAQEIISEMQDAVESQFRDGVFVGTEAPSSNGEVADSFDVIGSNKGSATTAETEILRYPVVMDVHGADKAEILRLLAPLAASEDTAASFTEFEDGILVSPLSVYKTAAALLDAANLTVIISEASVPAADGTVDEAFYIQIREP